MTDIVCKCGHFRKEHPNESQFPYIVCNGCFEQNRIRGVKQVGTIDCGYYIPDNLMHVEVLAKVRKLI